MCLPTSCTGDVAAALERNVGELGARGLLDRDRDDLVFLLRSRAAHLELVRAARLDRVEIILRGLVRRIGVDPQHELVERQHGDGVRSFQLNGTPVASGVVNRFDSVMMILLGSPFASLTARKPSAPAPPGLFTTIIGCFIRLFFGDDALKKPAPSDLAPPPVPAGHDELDGLRRLPCRLRRKRKRQRDRHARPSRTTTSAFVRRRRGRPDSSARPIP